MGTGADGMNIATRVRNRLWDLAKDRYLRARSVTTTGFCHCIGTLPRIENAGRIVIGNNVYLRGLPRPVRLETSATGSIQIGDNVLLNSAAHIFSASEVRIGDNSKVADECVISDFDFHAVDEGGKVRRAPIVLGNNVWLGRRVTVMPGVEIGDHSVVAAGSIVTKSIPARQVWGGNPARMIREVRASDAFVRA